MSPSTSLTPSALVRDAQRRAASLLQETCRQSACLPQQDGRHRLERLALSDLCETLLSRAELVVRSAPDVVRPGSTNRTEFVRLHLQGALLLWLAQVSLDACEQAAVQAALEHLGLTRPA